MKAIPKTQTKKMQIEFPKDTLEFCSDSKDYNKSFRIIERFFNGFFKPGFPMPLLLEVEDSILEIDFLGKNLQLYNDSKDILRSIYTQTMSMFFVNNTLNIPAFNDFLDMHEKFLAVGEQIFFNFNLNFLAFKGYKSFTELIHIIIKKLTENSRLSTNVIILELINSIQAQKIMNFMSSDIFPTFVDKIKSNQPAFLKWIKFLTNSGYYDDLINSYLKKTFDDWDHLLKLAASNNPEEIIEQFEFIEKQEEFTAEMLFPDSRRLIKERLANFFINLNMKILLEIFGNSIVSNKIVIAKKILGYFDLASKIQVIKTFTIRIEKDRLLACNSFSAILEFLKSYSNCTSEILSLHPEIFAEINVELQKTINTDKDISGDLFASHLDASIKHNKTETTEILLYLIKLVNDKDGYIKEFYKHFCKAILGKKFQEPYLSILTRLENSYGEETVIKFKNLLADLKEGECIFYQNTDDLPYDFSVQVLGKNQWPFEYEKDTSLINSIPPEFAGLVREAKKQYQNQRRLQDLDFQQRLSTAEIECSFKNVVVTIICKFKYIPLLLLFNRSTEWDVSILVMTLRIPMEKLTKMLKKLSQVGLVFFDNYIAKFQISEKIQSGKVIDLTSNIKGLKSMDSDAINKVDFDEEKKEEFIKRKEKQIKAFIMRKLKKQERMAIEVLVDSLKADLEIQLEHSDISGLIDDLINSEFIQRNETNLNMLIYRK